MLTSLPNFEIGLDILYWIEIVSMLIEVLAVAIISIALIIGTLNFVLQTARKQPDSEERFKQYRHHLARALLLGLEILVAADIIRTIALDATLQSMLVLGVLVLIRTFLGWSLTVEMEGRWPWQAKP